MAGVERAAGLTWTEEVAARRADALFKNVRVLGALRGDRFMAGMASMGPNLGVKCTHCHLEGAYASDEKEPKVAARRMLLMSHQMNRDFFSGKTRVTCFTCHRGDEKPPPAPFSSGGTPAMPQHPLATLSTENAAKPAEKVYRNILQFTGVPAGRIGPIMGFFTVGLGVQCAHCHVDGQWESDEKPAKRRAREMMRMVGMTAKQYYGGNTPVHCGMCHRGRPNPARNATDLSVSH